MLFVILNFKIGFMLLSFIKKKRKKDRFTIAFYNLENLFDTKDDPTKLDDDFTPDGFKKWTKKRYKKKLFKLAKTISRIGRKTTGSPPVIIGVAEVENKRVVKDLLNSKPLRDQPYEFVHFDSPDERGIDTALLFHKDHFTISRRQRIPLLVNNEDGIRDATRDILYVHGQLNGEEVHFFVNHWPSRRDGADLTEHKRVKAAQTLLDFVSVLESEARVQNLIIMGDFNDGPASRSIEYLVSERQLYNPMAKLLSPERGSANYRRIWSLFDQIIISHSFFNYEKGSHSFSKADIFDDHSLAIWKGRFKGNPFRTYAGRKYKGGFSDHFPVYIQLDYHR